MESHDLDNNKTLRAFDKLLGIMAELREKCPWDQKQTMESLRHLTIEEAFELSEAILGGNMDNIKEELGDLLLHIVFHARLAAEKHAFTINEVLQDLCKKLIRRHPHIYGPEAAKDIAAAERNWESVKLTEKENKSVLSGVPNALPSLIKAMRIQEKVNKIGFDWQEREAIWSEVQEEIEQLIQKVRQTSPATTQQEKAEEAFGDLLFVLVKYARCVKINPEDALEKANKKFISIFQYIEGQLVKQGKQITQLSPKELLSYWEQAKQQAMS